MKYFIKPCEFEDLKVGDWFTWGTRDLAHQIVEIDLKQERLKYNLGGVPCRVFFPRDKGYFPSDWFYYNNHHSAALLVPERIKEPEEWL